MSFSLPKMIFFIAYSLLILIINLFPYFKHSIIYVILEIVQESCYLTLFFLILYQGYLLDNKIDSALWLTRVFTIISAILYILPLFRYVL